MIPDLLPALKVEAWDVMGESDLAIVSVDAVDKRTASLAPSRGGEGVR
jgi:hypothetical protein